MTPDLASTIVLLAGAFAGALVSSFAGFAFAQHAWAIATHDLVYKTDDVSWSRQRIAYQIKAMLEHAEISIQEADQLAGTVALAKAHRDTEEIKGIISFLKETWEADFLPTDLRRLAENARAVMRLAEADLNALRASIAAERDRQRGALPTNISPYCIIVQALARSHETRMRTNLRRHKARERMIVTPEMDLPDWLAAPGFVNLIRVAEDAQT